jgi:hypothetical protein
LSSANSKLSVLQQLGKIESIKWWNFIFL